MGCAECPLANCAKVVARGPLDAPVVIVGQSPGAEEIQRGVPFVGPSGRILVQALAEAGFDESELLFTNAVRCSDGTTPNKTTIKHCHGHLIKLLSAHPHQLVIALGNEAWFSLCGGGVGGALKGQGRVAQAEDGPWQVFWNLHPAYILRNEAARENWVQQFRRAKAMLEGGLRRLEPEVEIVAPGHLPIEHLSDDHWALSSDMLSFDVETTGLCYWQEHLLGVGLSDGERALYISIAHGPQSPVEPLLEGMVGLTPMLSPEGRQRATQWLQTALGGGRKLVAHNSKFDAKFLINELGVDPRPIWLDTMLAHHLIDENAPHGLKPITQTWLMVESWEDEVEAGKQAGKLHEEPLEQVALYCGADAMATVLLAKPIWDRLGEEKCRPLYRRLVGPLSDALVDVELRGMVIDRVRLDRLGSIMLFARGVAAKEVRRLSGFGRGTECSWRNDDQEGINPGSTQDLVNVLYSDPEGFNLEPQRFTKGKAPSTDEEALEGLLDGRCPKRARDFIEALLHYRGLVKLDGTYVSGMWKYIEPDEGAVHASFMFNPNTEDSPRTGRLSSSYPNLQNQPKEIRPLFGAREGYKFWEADQGNLEVRVWAHISQDPGLIEVFKRSAGGEVDYHTMVAAICFSVPYEEVTKEQRDISKVVTFGSVMYGGEEWVLSRVMKAPVEEVRPLLTRLFRAFPQGQAWLQEQVRFAYANGYVVSPLGRRRRIPELHSHDEKVRMHAERVSKNSLIQGLASDINNLAMLRLRAFINDRGYDAYVVNIVHDSVLVEVAEDIVDQVAPEFVAVLEEPPWEGFSVPLQVEAFVTDRWGGELDVDSLVRK